MRPSVFQIRRIGNGGAPGVIPGIEITYLNGKDTPTMETQVDFNTLGIKHRIYMDVGVNILDFRAFYKSTGKDA